LSSFIFFFLAHDWVPSDKKRPDYIVKHPWAKDIPSLVLYLAQQLPSSHYIIVTDSYFTSAKAFRSLAAAGFHAVGTLKGSSDVSKDLLWKKHQKLPFGAAKFLRSTDRQLLVQEWKDSAVVRVMSTCHTGVAGLAASYANLPGISTVTRWRKAGVSYAKSTGPCPPTIKFYQKTMRGVDMADHKRAAYTCRRKTHRWYVTLLYFVIDVAVVNAFITRNLALGNEKLRRQLDFRTDLVHGLLSVATALRTVPRSMAVVASRQMPASSGGQLPAARLIGAEHLPTYVDRKSHCVLCTFMGLKGKTTRVRCVCCSVSLCFVPTRNCFIKYHSVDVIRDRFADDPQDSDFRTSCEDDSENE
jgi:hypothetical protein